MDCGDALSLLRACLDPSHYSVLHKTRNGPDPTRCSGLSSASNSSNPFRLDQWIRAGCFQVHWTQSFPPCARPPRIRAPVLGKIERYRLLTSNHIVLDTSILVNPSHGSLLIRQRLEFRQLCGTQHLMRIHFLENRRMSETHPTVQRSR
jgi:hypothetical protein